MAVMGRPTKLTPELRKKAKMYIHCYKQLDDVIPTVVGLALFLGVLRDSIRLWAKNDAEISALVAEITQKQEQELAKGGLRGSFNASITKLLLTKHGYSDKVDQTQRNVDMTHEQWLESLDDGED